MDGIDPVGFEGYIKAYHHTIFGELIIAHWHCLLIHGWRTIGAVIMVAPGADGRSNLFANPFGKGNRKTGLRQAGGMYGKGNRFPIPLSILNRSAFASLAKPSTPNLGGPEATQWIEGHFDWSTFQSP